LLGFFLQASQKFEKMHHKLRFTSGVSSAGACIPEMAVVQQRFGILWCEDSAKWTGQWSLYVNALGEHDSEVWEVFHVCEGQLPSLDAIHDYTGTMVGAHFNLWLNR
jgi:hypothetical protein